MEGRFLTGQSPQWAVVPMEEKEEEEEVPRCTTYRFNTSTIHSLIAARIEIYQPRNL